MCDSLVVRRVTRGDLDNLLLLLIESKPDAKITRTSLERDLICGHELKLSDAQQVLAQNDDPALELDLSVAKSNVPAVQGYLGTVGEQPVGIVLFHYHFSPWTGPIAAINHIYVRPTQRNKGIATSLLGELQALCRREGVKKVMYEISKIPPELMARIHKHGTRVYRNDDTEWSVFRINF